MSTPKVILTDPAKAIKVLVDPNNPNVKQKSKVKDGEG
jgi:hypothetical protein